MRPVVLFSGYGSHFGARGKEVYDASRAVQEYFEEAATCVQAPVVKWAFGSSEIGLSDTFEGYVTSALLGIMYVTVLKERGLKPVALAGMGSGMLPAIHTAQVVSLPDMLYLARKVAQFYQEYLHAHNSALVAMSGISPDEVLRLCAASDRVMVSGTLPSGAQRVFGDRVAVEAVIEQARAVSPDFAFQELPVEEGIFCGLGAPIADQLVLYLEKVDLRPLQGAIIRADTGAFLTDAEIRDYVGQFMMRPVEWPLVLEASAQAGDLLIVAGYAPELYESLRAHSKIPVEMVASMDDIERIVAQGVPPAENLSDEKGNDAD